MSSLSFLPLLQKLFAKIWNLLCVLYCVLTSFILQDVQWSDIDYMKLYLDWTYDADGAYADLPAIVKDLHDHDQKYVIIVVSLLPFVSRCWRQG